MIVSSIGASSALLIELPAGWYPAGWYLAGWYPAGWYTAGWYMGVPWLVPGTVLAVVTAPRSEGCIVLAGATCDCKM